MSNDFFVLLILFNRECMNNLKRLI